MEMIPYIQDRKKKGEKVMSCKLLDRLIDEGMEKGKQAGRQEESRLNAKMLFRNGATMELVAASIKSLSKEELQEIYNEIMNFRIAD